MAHNNGIGEAPNEPYVLLNVLSGGTPEHSAKVETVVHDCYNCIGEDLMEALQPALSLSRNHAVDFDSEVLMHNRYSLSIP